jgi:hypothetical protein
MWPDPLLAPAPPSVSEPAAADVVGEWCALPQVITVPPVRTTNTTLAIGRSLVATIAQPRVLKLVASVDGADRFERR